MKKIDYKFLVVYEDLWSNKISFKTNKVGDTILEIMRDYELNLGQGVEISKEEAERINDDFPYLLYKTNKIGDTISGILKRFNLKLEEDQVLDIEKLNSDYPFEAGTFGPGFYDMYLYDNDDEGEPNGKIMIFYIGEEDEEDHSEQKCMIKIDKDAVVYDNEDDSIVLAKAGTYAKPTDIVLIGIDTSDPSNRRNTFKPDYVGESEDYILLAWDDSHGILSVNEYTKI